VKHVPKMTWKEYRIRDCPDSVQQNMSLWKMRKKSTSSGGNGKKKQLGESTTGREELEVEYLNGGKPALEDTNLVDLQSV